MNWKKIMNSIIDLLKKNLKLKKNFGKNEKMNSKKN